jgi:hypothetical protein
MDLQSGPIPATVSDGRFGEADTTLHGGRLLLAKIAWFALVAFTLSVYLGSLPAYLTVLQTVCRPAVCAYGQLSPETAVVIKHFGLSVDSYAPFMFAIVILFALVVFGSGAVLFWRRSDDWMVLLFALGLVMGGTIPVMLTVGTSPIAWRLPISIVVELFFLVFFLGFSVFPNGRFVPRWIPWLFVVYGLASIVYTFFTDFLLHVSLWITVPLLLLFLSLYAGLVIAQVYRYRYVFTPAQRQQIKWILYGLTASIVVSVGVPALLFPQSFFPVMYPLIYICASMFYPFTIGIAVLRYRLWDIDILINRTLVYSTLTVLLALVYFGLVIGLQSLVHLITGTVSEQPLVIVASTLAIAALFHPLRRRIQNLIDRRFYRRKYDAAKTLETFNATLRNEVDLDELREQLLAVVQETMQPMHASLWLRKPEEDGKKFL